jgi:arylformamidase
MVGRGAGSRKDFGYPAELFVHAGAHYVVPDFINVTEANGSLMPMAEQVRRAVAWVYRNAQSFGRPTASTFLATLRWPSCRRCPRH